MAIELIGGTNEEGLPLSQAVRAGGFVFISGMVGLGSNGKIVPGGIGSETGRIIADLRKFLEQLGATLTDVVKVNVYLIDANDFDEFNRAYTSYFGSAPPARTGVVTELTIDARVEMDFIAYIGK